jgi:polar amino acid transport system substrate-binding protein
VGAVPTGFTRKNYYNKELELKMSCSYGPGRYDPEYEEQGIDYPYAYVRWTENRNMQAFADLMASKKIDIRPLITHTIAFKDAKSAYDMILNRTESFAGIVLEYDTQKQLKNRVELSTERIAEAAISVGMIGAGSFGQNFLLPALKGKANMIGVATARPNNARNVADKFGFNYCTGNADELIQDKNINTIFIATRHDSHAEYVIKALKADKNVFTEKPLCLYPAELELIKDAYSASNRQLFVGFNRRFAPLTQELLKHINREVPSAILFRINAGIVPKEHWIHDPKTGGGRIIGEACHFIDYCAFLCGSKITEVAAYALKDPSGLNDTVSISLKMENGSVATIAYYSNGNKDVSKEYVEVFNGGVIARIDDFKELIVNGPKGTRKFKSVQDKGHKAEVEAFANALRNGKPAPISFDELYNATLSTFKVLESIAINGKTLVTK